tara:strand:- start:5033 stop:5797 length:765 start_codon:yes stop_codon:yes gene_type:complete
MKMNKCAYGYVRVSTQKQVMDGGHSIEDQEKKIIAWCELQDVKLLYTYIDKGVSGTFMFERPQFSKLIREIDEGDILVAYDLSRVSRNSRDTAELIERLEKIKAHAVFIKDGFDTSTMMGKSMAQMASIMKSMEANYTSERVKDVMQSKKEKGQCIGRPPYGWKKADDSPGSGLVEDPYQQNIIKEIRIMRDDKNYSWDKIADYLTKGKFVGPGGYEKPDNRGRRKPKKWHPNTIRTIYNRKPSDVPTASKFDK